jgi:nicotinate-nucleotide adenylyltransferase
VVCLGTACRSCNTLRKLHAALEFFRRAEKTPTRLGILPGTFNPVTVAHIGMAEAALGFVDEVVFVLPRVFPHKPYSGASFEQRVELLRTGLSLHPAFSIATTSRGLFAEIAEACRTAYGSRATLSFVCGADAAERIISWDYGRTGAIREMMKQFDLLVADRGGEYTPPGEYSGFVRRLPLDAVLQAVSATGVRERIARGEAWEHLVPAAIREAVGRIYRPIEDSYSRQGM